MLEYPLQERLIDSRGKSPAYEDFKDRLRYQSSVKLVKDIKQASLFDNPIRQEIVDRQTQEIDEQEEFEKFKSRGLISIKALAAKPAESRNQAEVNFLMLYMKLNHPAVFKDCDKDTIAGLVKRVSA